MSLHGDKPQPGSKSETASAIRDAAGGFLAKGLAAVTTSTDSFIQLAGMSDIYEIQAAHIALQRSRREDVKAFAQQMIKDHSKTSEELKSMAGAMNEPKTPPTSLNALFQTLIDDLNGVPDEDFDTRYLAQQEAAHSVAITLLKTFRDRGDNSSLRELCKLALPIIEHHMQMVQEMRGAQ